MAKKAKRGKKSAKRRPGLFGAMRDALFDLGGLASGKSGRSAKLGPDAHWVPISLDDMLEKHRDDAAHVVSLAEYKGALGAKWESLSERILHISENALREFIGPGNHCMLEGDETFVLVFPKVPHIDAELKACEAAIELGRLLVGEKFAGWETRPRIAAIEASALLAADGKTDLSLLADVAAMAQPLGEEENKTRRASGEDEADGSGIDAPLATPVQDYKMAPIQHKSRLKRSKPKLTEFKHDPRRSSEGPIMVAMEPHKQKDDNDWLWAPRTDKPKKPKKPE